MKRSYADGVLEALNELQTHRIGRGTLPALLLFMLEDYGYKTDFDDEQECWVWVV
jgi:hypothetical protein